LAKESATCVLLQEQVVKILGKHTNVFRYAMAWKTMDGTLKKRMPFSGHILIRMAESRK
jgi:hypothetical protein